MGIENFTDEAKNVTQESRNCLPDFSAFIGAHATREDYSPKTMAKAMQESGATVQSIQDLNGAFGKVFSGKNIAEAMPGVSVQTIQDLKETLGNKNSPKHHDDIGAIADAYFQGLQDMKQSMGKQSSSKYVVEGISGSGASVETIRDAKQTFSKEYSPKDVTSMIGDAAAATHGFHLPIMQITGKGDGDLPVVNQGGDLQVRPSREESLGKGDGSLPNINQVPDHGLQDLENRLLGRPSRN